MNNFYENLLIAMPCLLLGALIVYFIGRTFSEPTL